MDMRATSSFTGVAEIELTYRSQVNPSDRPQVSDPEEAYKLLLKHWDLNRIDLQEQFKVMILNVAGHVIGIYESSSGSTNQTVVDQKLIFTCALKANASKIILCHNHPSGSLKPSVQDKRITKLMVEAGKILDIRVDDHLIISRYGFLSMQEEGLM